ncbi:MAG: PDGLE domain-containing protein [Candidatus Nanopelagicales bacterium]
MKTKSLIMAGLLLSGFLAGAVSYYASSQPDGLEKVAIDLGFIDQAKDSPTGTSPFADYTVSFLGDARLSTAIAGITGVIATGLLGAGLYLWVRKPQSK